MSPPKHSPTTVNTELQQFHCVAAHKLISSSILTIDCQLLFFNYFLLNSAFFLFLIASSISSIAAFKLSEIERNHAMEKSTWLLYGAPKLFTPLLVDTYGCHSISVAFVIAIAIAFADLSGDIYAKLIIRKVKKLGKFAESSLRSLSGCLIGCLTARLQAFR